MPLKLWLRISKLITRKTLPNKEFLLPYIPTEDLGNPNVPAFKCKECKRIIYQQNFYHCPVERCLVQPKLGKDQIGERMITYSDLYKLHNPNKKSK